MREQLTSEANMRTFPVMLLISGLTFAGGCTSMALTAGSMVAGQGVDHTLSGISYKTFAASMDDMRAATFKTLDRLDMDITDQVQIKAGWKILAIARNRRIEIDLERLTRRATRMRVVAHEGEIFFKDAATATEIIVQTAETLAVEAAQAPATGDGPASGTNLEPGPESARLTFGQ